MGWVVNESGERIYKPSSYTKDELPTWSEIYHDFYQNMFLKDNYKDDGTIDKYWKIPRQKYILGMVCNQFNKMIIEDNDFKEKITNEINMVQKYQCDNIRFLCHINHIIWCNKIVYSIHLPNGQENPFIPQEVLIKEREEDHASGKHRIYMDVEDLDLEYGIHPYLFDDTLKSYSSGNKKKLPFVELEGEDKNKAIEILMKNIREYFEGDSIGWKDKEGNNISDKTPIKNNCNGAGVDPAL